MRTALRSTGDELLGAFDLLQLPAFVIDGAGRHCRVQRERFAGAGV